MSKDYSQITFCDPPPIVRKGKPLGGQQIRYPSHVDGQFPLDPFWKAVADKARDVSPRWLSVGRHSPTVVTNIRNGKYASFRPAGYFDATCREVADGEATIYVRCTGEPS